MRPSLDQYMMGIAKLAATRTTCLRRGVGCVLTDNRGHLLAVGYNGVASGMPHCNEVVRSGGNLNLEHYGNACKGQGTPEGKASCEAVHAEQNALLQCHEVWEIATAYVTRSPCTPCMKLLLNTSCQHLVVLEKCSDLSALELWERSGRTWELLEGE